jgi:hypothetical protein
MQPPDSFSPYEAGLRRLLDRIGRDDPRHLDALTYQDRLLENIRQTRLDGDTETRRAERAEDLRALLLDFHWQWAKLDATDIAGLLADYDDGPNDAAPRLVAGALRLSAHILAHDKPQIGGQLCGRLLAFDNPDIQVLMERMRQPGP